IDGERTITVAAPADHYSAAPDGETGPGHYQVFNGTSGALPQVAGAIALLLQKEPGLTPEEVRTRLRTSAYGDDATGVVPNDAWGGGRLDVHRLLFGDAAQENGRPDIDVDARSCGVSGEPLDVDASATTDDHD